jgi:prepilin-type N-terminal cleavage/methylation domain-containing protein
MRSKEMPIFSFFSSPFRNFSNFFKVCQRQFIALTTPRKHRAKTLGFTIIEVLVVMIMVGILSAIAAPSWLGFVSNQRINTSQSKIFQAIKVAQSDAKVRKSDNDGKRVRITFRTGQTENAYKLDNVRANGGEQSLEQGIVFSSITPATIKTDPTPVTGGRYIEFDSRGFLFDPNNDLTYPICINLSVSNSPRIRWIAIKTLLGAVVTGSEGTCS